MAIEIRPFSTGWLTAVQEFNGRLRATGMQLPEDPAVEMLPGSQMYVAVEGRDVRGGYLLRPQTFSFYGELRRVAHLRLPLSEGAVDRSYARVGPLLVRSALQAEPLLYALGMGGFDRPLPRMLQALGWSVTPVPFYFRVVHAARFLRGMRAARATGWWAALMDLAAWTGAGRLAIQGWQWSRTRRERERSAFPRNQAKEIGEFGGWADAVWAACQAAYGMAAMRDARTLGELYGGARFLRMRVNRSGWAVLLDTPMQDDPYFGDLRVGTIVDCLSSPSEAARVIQAARRLLEERGVDLIISNQSHGAWGRAFETNGFFQGPSNFLFGASRGLAALKVSPAEMHLNRGDGDGPVHL